MIIHVNDFVNVHSFIVHHCTSLSATFNHINRNVHDVIISSLSEHPPIGEDHRQPGCGRRRTPTAKKLLGLRHRNFSSVQDYNFEFTSTHHSLKASLMADDSEPIKGLPDCTLRGMHLDSFDQSFENLRESIESDDAGEP
mmetsp:Transcript_4432/g.8890  ORF Transcript_4432/g.8890 Transcript_4432/m.8890 type:complete len:140 (-) Transcript_4432:255-674(-)